MKEDCDKPGRICERPYEKNNYYYGKLMTARDFFAEQFYFNRKRWLINRMVLGWGVVCGLKVSLKDIDKPGEEPMVEVEPGMAIDSCGREILVCKAETIKLIPEDAGHAWRAEERVHHDGRIHLAVCLEYRHCMADPVQGPPDACGKDIRQEFNRIRDSFAIKVRYESDVPHEDREPFCPLFDPEARDRETFKPVHGYLCKKLEEGCLECANGHCVVIAKVFVDPKDPSKIDFDQCYERRLVYNNRLLYDLIDCYHGDLPHVTGINWKHGETLDAEYLEHHLAREGLVVHFDKKLIEETVNHNTFLFRIKMENAETGQSWYENIPGKVSYSYDGFSNESKAVFSFTEEWLDDAFHGYSRLRKHGGKFMVVLRGDFILGEHPRHRAHRALDGNFIGGRLPSGNGTQGGDFISWFRVEPNHNHDHDHREVVRSEDEHE